MKFPTPAAAAVTGAAQAQIGTPAIRRGAAPRADLAILSLPTLSHPSWPTAASRQASTIPGGCAR